MDSTAGASGESPNLALAARLSTGCVVIGRQPATPISWLFGGAKRYLALKSLNASAVLAIRSDTDGPKPK
jgi:hypothetical protein